MQRRCAKQTATSRPSVHRFDLGHRVVIPRHGKVVTIGDLFLSVIDHISDSAQRLFSPADGKLHPAMLAIPLAPRYPLAPLRVHVFLIEKRRIVDMHVAIEGSNPFFMFLSVL